MVRASAKHIFISFLFILTIFLTSTKTNSESPAKEGKQSIFTDKRTWGLKYDKHGIIDPTPDVKTLRFLPRDSYNFVDWAKALSDGIIAPLDSITGEEDHVVQFSKDIVIKSKMDFMPDVLFRTTFTTSGSPATTVIQNCLRQRPGQRPSAWPASGTASSVEDVMTRWLFRSEIASSAIRLKGR